MELIGVDMTSAPGRRSPITAARGRLTGDRVEVGPVVECTFWAEYETLLAEPRPWVAAIGHPFGLPAATVSALGWPKEWEAYMARVDAHPDRATFRDAWSHTAVIDRARDKHQFDQDREVGAASPVNTQNPPVALMFYEGARRLAAADVDIHPCRPLPARDRVVAEGYPRLVARELIEDRPYKGGPPVRGHVTALTRAALLDALAGDACREAYGVTIEVGPEDRDRIEHDWSGDLIDAVLCLAQAAYAETREDGRYGVPADVDPDEGWIVDPSTAGGAPAV